MNTDLFELLKLVVGSGGLLTLGVIFYRTGKIVEKIDGINERLKSLESNLPGLTIAITRIEVRLEERSSGRYAQPQKKEMEKK